MSSGPFTRTNRNTPQRNLNKSQQPTQASFTPSQPTVIQEPNKGGYVYKPPTRIARTNGDTVKQIAKIVEKASIKKEEPLKNLQSTKIQQPPVQKPVSYGRKPATQVNMQTTVRTTTIVTEVTETKQEIKPTAVKSVSKLPTNRYNEISSNLVITSPKKQQTSKPQQVPKPITSTYGRTKPPVEQKSLVKPTTLTKNPLQQLVQDSTQYVPALEIKKPKPFNSYPKKITRRQSQRDGVEAQGQKKQQPPVSFEEAKPQTPKFSQQHNQQAPKAPQMFSSTYSYRNKNVNSQFSSQSATSLKQPIYQSVIQPPVQKVSQTQKPSSAIVDSPMKSPAKTPMLHASRYSNTVQTPAKQEKIAHSQQQAPKFPVKRSPMLGFVLHRLYTQKMTSYFHNFIQYAKSIKQAKANQKNHQYFERSLTKFIKVYEQNFLTRHSFGLIKSIFSKLMKVDMTKSTDPKITNQLIANRNQCVGKVMQNIIPSSLMELKFSFIKLKSNLNEVRSHQNKLEAGVKILCGVEFQKMKENFNNLSEWTNSKHQVKLWKMSRCSEINSAYRKWLLKESWTKLTFNKIKELVPEVKNLPTKVVSKSLMIKTPQPTIIQPEQSQANTQLKQKVSNLETKLSETQQKVAQVPKQSDLRKTIQELKEQKNQVTQEITAKKQRNSQLKQKLQKLISKEPHESLPSLSETKNQNQEPTLILLHEIYMKIYKQPESQCISEENMASLCSIHRVEENSQMRQIVAKWLAIRENMSLKNWINLYQGNYISDQGLVGQRREIHKQIEEENDIVNKFIRSYVKERYMWEEVKEYVAAVISE